MVFRWFGLLMILVSPFLGVFLKDLLSKKKNDSPERPDLVVEAHSSRTQKKESFGSCLEKRTGLEHICL